jgi:hypothetical protein
VAMGIWDDKTICTSTDGLTWTVPINPPEAALISSNIASAAIWNGSTWVVAGNWFDSLGTALGNVTSLTYGINFSKPVHPSGAILGTTRTVVWNPNTNKWLAGAVDSKWGDNNLNLSTSSSGILTSSTDGLNWTTPTNLNGIDTISPFSQIAVINERVYIIGTINYNIQAIMNSTDGINWSIQPFTDNKFGTGNGIAWNESAWTAVGNFRIKDWGVNITGPIIISTDGQTWSEPIFPIVPITPTIQAILNSPDANLGVTYSSILNSVGWNGQVWVAVGNIRLNLGQALQYNVGQIVRCSDINNLIWTMTPISVLETIDNYAASSIGKAVAWNGRIWVVVGKFGLTPRYITTSIDGIAWSDPIALVNASAGQANGVAWNGNIWIVVGAWQDIEGNQLNVARSTDGITWSPAINVLPSTSYNLTSITWNGTKFVAGGSDNISGNAVILVSADGITWTYADPLLTPGIGIYGIGSKRILPFTSLNKYILHNSAH